VVDALAVEVDEPPDVLPDELFADAESAVAIADAAMDWLVATDDVDRSCLLLIV